MEQRFSGDVIRRTEIAQSTPATVLFVDDPAVGRDRVAHRADLDHVADLRRHFGAGTVRHYAEEIQELS